MKITAHILLIAFILFSCKEKKKVENAPKLTPVLSFIQSQVAHVDTSLYSIRKVTLGEAGGGDTVYFPREEFRNLAGDFLSIPDLMEEKYEGRYTKESRFDETLNRLIITMLPVDPEEEDIQREEVLIEPNPSGDRIAAIIIDLVKSNRDSSIQKRMLWLVDESFQVATTRQLKAQPETTTTYRVIWNEPEQPYEAEENKENE